MAIESSLIAGAMIGLSIAAPLGPSSMLCIHRTLGDGLQTGMVTGLGIATVHLAYGIVAGVNGLTLAAIWHGNFLFPLMSSLILMAFAFRILRTAIVLEPAFVGQRMSPAFAYLGAVLFSFLNPLTPILFAALSPSLMLRDPGSTPYMILGVFIGSLLWWMFLTISVSYFRGRLTARLLTIGNRAAGALLAVMAISVVVRGFDGLP